MALKINNDTFTVSPELDPVSVSGSYHTIDSIYWNKNSTTDIRVSLYKSSGSYAASSGSYHVNHHFVTLGQDVSNQNILSCSYEALKSQVSMYSGSVHVIDI
jgi:hypothetical protein